MAQQQTAYVGDDIKILVNVVDSTGSHVAASINTSTTRLHGFSTIPTVTTIGTGIYQINFSGVTPSPSEGDRLICKVNGDIGGTAWSEYAVPVIIVADERGTTPTDVYSEFTSGSNADSFKADVSTLPTASDIYSFFTNSTNPDPFKADVTGIAADIAALNDLSQADIRTAVGLASANLDTQLGDIPNNSEFNARTLASADYATSSSISALNNLSQADIRTAVGLATANLDTQLGNIPTVSEFNARTLVSADYATSASISALQDLSQADIRAAIGLATANIDIQLSGISTQVTTVDGVVDSILIDTGTDIPTLINNLNDLSQADIRTAVGLASNNLDTQLGNIPTVGEFNARSLASADYATSASIAALQDLSQADIRSAVGLASANLDTQIGTLATSVEITALNDPTSAQIADAVWDEILTGATHNIPTSAGRRLRQVADVGVYEGAQVWIDTVNGAAGTANYEDGTVDNPSNNIADATTIANSVGITRFRIAPDSSFTLATGYSGYNFWGDGHWTLGLGGQSLDRTSILNAIVSGTCTAVEHPSFERCDIGVVTLPPCYIVESRLTSAITLSGAGDYHIAHCSSAVAGTGSPSIDFGSAGNTNLSMRHYSGGIEILNMGQNGTDNMSLEGNGQLRINANCVGGTIAVRGNFKITDNSGGAVTIVRDDNSQTLTEMPTASEIATEVLAAGNVDGYTLEQTLRLCLAALAGKISGAGTGTITIRSADDSTDRIVASTDTKGNRLSITITP